MKRNLWWVELALLVFGGHNPTSRWGFAARREKTASPQRKNGILVRPLNNPSSITPQRPREKTRTAWKNKRATGRTLRYASKGRQDQHYFPQAAIFHLPTPNVLLSSVCRASLLQVRPGRQKHSRVEDREFFFSKPILEELFRPLRPVNLCRGRFRLRNGDVSNSRLRRKRGRGGRGEDDRRVEPRSRQASSRWKILRAACPPAYSLLSTFETSSQNHLSRTSSLRLRLRVVRRPPDHVHHLKRGLNGAVVFSVQLW